MRKELRVLVIGGLFMGACWGGGSIVSAADAAPVYELNPVVVTAQRTQTEDLKTPAAVQVLTAEDIRKTGATNVQQALAYSTGIITHGQGPRAISMGTMNDKAVIRGNEKGTLVLVDGVPMNQNGKYYLESIPTDSIQKIEVVRGGGAVLYGSEASGGVINIITKGTRKNMVKAGLGNYGVQNYAASVQAGKFGLTYSFDHTGKVDKISAPLKNSSRGIDGLYYNIVRGEKHNVDARYNFNDKLYLTTSFSKEQSNYRQKYDGRAPYRAQKGMVTANRSYEWERNMTQLHYDDGDLKAYVFYNFNNYRSDGDSISTRSSHKSSSSGSHSSGMNGRSSGGMSGGMSGRSGSTGGRSGGMGGHSGSMGGHHSSTANTPWYKKKPTKSWSLERDQTYGLDVSKRWKTDWGSYMVGYDFQRDLQKTDGSVSMMNRTPFQRYARNMHAIYGQLAYDFTAKDTADFNFRETWTESDGQGNRYDKFTPEVTYTHSFDSDTSLYARVGKSFMMPTFTQLYGGGNVRSNPGLKPETGMHYELGFKKDLGKSTWRVALFHYKIKDSIDADLKDYPEIKYDNADVRNTGIEVDWSRQQNANLSYHAGFTYGHPEKKTDYENYKKKDMSEAQKKYDGKWHDYYGRIQFNTGITYISGKLTSAFEMSVLGDRTRDDASIDYPHFKDQCLTDLNFSYQANKDCRFFLNIDNLFNRHDIITTGASSYYDLGRNFMAGVEYTF